MGTELVRVDVGSRDRVDDVESFGEESWHLPVWPLEDSDQCSEETEAKRTCDASDCLIHPLPEALV